MNKETFLFWHVHPYTHVCVATMHWFSTPSGSLGKLSRPHKIFPSGMTWVWNVPCLRLKVVLAWPRRVAVACTVTVALTSSAGAADLDIWWKNKTKATNLSSTVLSMFELYGHVIHLWVSLHHQESSYEPKLTLLACFLRDLAYLCRQCRAPQE